MSYLCCHDAPIPIISIGKQQHKYNTKPGLPGVFYSRLQIIVVSLHTQNKFVIKEFD